MSKFREEGRPLQEAAYDRGLARRGYQSLRTTLGERRAHLFRKMAQCGFITPKASVILLSLLRKACNPFLKQVQSHSHGCSGANRYDVLQLVLSVVGISLHVGRMAVTPFSIGGNETYRFMLRTSCSDSVTRRENGGYAILDRRQRNLPIHATYELLGFRYT